MRQASPLKIILIVVFLLAFFVVLNLTPLPKPIKNFFYSISQPFQNFFWQIGDKSSDFFGGISASQNLKKENEKLNLQIQRFLAENSSLQELKKENDFLREALNLGLEKEFQLKMAEITGKDISQDTLLINKGLKEGLSKDLPVVTGQRVLVGKIGEVFQDFSKVILVSSKDMSFDAKIYGKEIYGISRGAGNSRLSFEFIPKDQELQEGDQLLTTILGGIFPKGLLVGEIREIEKNDLGPFQKARVKTAFDIALTQNLFVVLSY